jgi:hypothetical protein
VSVAQQGWSCITTITRAVEAGFVHKKIIGTGDEFEKVILRLEPLPWGSGSVRLWQDDWLERQRRRRIFGK